MIHQNLHIEPDTEVKSRQFDDFTSVTLITSARTNDQQNYTHPQMAIFVTEKSAEVALRYGRELVRAAKYWIAHKEWNDV